MKEHVIDAKNRKIGRVASEAAMLLMGKNTTAYRPNVTPNIRVKIINTSQADISTKQKIEKNYVQYSGYPGGLRNESLSQVIEQKGHKEVFLRAVSGMLPHNKLHAKMLKNLTITE
ncbi:50S ribosomal protein L13 [Candidatus Parcubacteria bacterium]|nr:50S ribosomal protein L13 [Candidatus Parcubacteria bacterium]